MNSDQHSVAAPFSPASFGGPFEGHPSPLPESEQSFRQFAQHSHDAFWLTSAEGEICYTNAAWRRIFGRSDDGRNLFHWMDCVPEEDRPLLEAEAASALTGGFTLEHRLLWPDGTVRWLRTRGFPIAQNLGEAGYRGWCAADITDRKEAEEALSRLSGELLRLQDEERRRLARELHDTTVQKLAALSMNLGLLDSVLPPLDAKPRKLLTDSILLVDQCSHELRTLSYLLHPPMLEELGLAGAVRDYADGFAGRSGLRVDLEVSEELGRLSREAELTLFRVLQECLANVHRHSGSRTASIRLQRNQEDIRLEVEDTGRGIAVDAQAIVAGTGVGLSGMRERLRHLRGTLEIESSSKGTKVKAVVPLKPSVSPKP
ncbi:MAG: PAS domain-containing sensor histidine kinase [Verrucomicrobiota bacterium]